MGANCSLQHFVMLSPFIWQQAAPRISVSLHVYDRKDKVRYIYKSNQQVLPTNNTCHEMQVKVYY